MKRIFGYSALALTMGASAPSSGTTVTATGDFGCSVSIIVSAIVTVARSQRLLGLMSLQLGSTRGRPL